MTDAQSPESAGDLPPPAPDSQPACAILFDRHGRITQANEALRDLFGLDPEAVVGKSVQALLPGEVTAEPRFCPEIEKVRRVGALSFERIGQRADGTQFLFRATTTVVPAERDRDRRYCVTIEDVTDRHRAEQALAESERKYRGLFNDAQVGLFRVSMTDRRFLEVTDRLAHMNGYSTREEFLQLENPALTYVNPEDDRAVDAIMAADGELRDYEAPFRRKDGSVFWARFSAKAFPEQGYVEGVATDTTDRRLAREALAESERKYRSLFEDSPLAMWEDDYSELRGYLEDLKASGIDDLEQYFVAHPDSVEKGYSLMRVVRVNEAAVRMFGAGSRDELAGALPRIFRDEDHRTFARGMAAMADGTLRRSGEITVTDMAGETLFCLARRLVIPGHEQTWDRVLISAVDLTERKKAEEALAESERRYRLLAENATDFIFTMDMDLRFTYASPSAESLLGHAPEEIVGRPLDAIVAAESVPLVLDTVREEMERDDREGFTPGRSRMLPLKLRRKDGETVWGEINARFLRDDRNRPVGLVGVARDITDRRRAEEALRESEAKYRAVVENAGEAIFCMDAQGVYTFMNTTAAQRIGGTPEQFVGKSMWDVFPKELADAQSARVRRVIDSGKGTVNEALTLVGGEHRWYHTNIQPLAEQDGSVDSALIIASDITQIKRAEEILARANVELEAQVRQRTTELAAANAKLERELAEHRRADEALRESEQRFRQIYEATGDAVYKRDLETGLLDYISPAAETVCGSTESELKDLSFEETLERFHPQDRPQFLAVAAAQRDGTIDQSLLKDVEFRWLHGDGSYRWLSDSRTLIRDEAGRPVSLIGALRDITELKQADDALRESEQRYRGLFESSADAIFVLTGNAEIIDVNPRALELTGYTRSELLSRTIQDLHPPQEWPDAVARWEQADAQGRFMHLDECHYVRKDGTRVPVSIAGAVQQREPRMIAIAHVRDITERVEAAERLKASESLYRALFENAPIPMMLLDDDLVIREINGAHVNNPAFGSSREKLIGFSMRTARDTGPIAAMERALAGETTTTEGVYHTTTSGVSFPYRSIIAPVRLMDGQRGVLAIIQDISEELRHREELRQMAERAVEALEDERNHISRELHDELGQNLTALKLDAAALATDAEAVDVPLADQAAEMGRLIDRTISMARRMASNLRPLALDDLGLADAIEWLAEQVASRAGLNYEITIEPEELHVSQAVATTAYRIVQESLTNIVRHANARNIQILLTIGTNGLTISIEDDGRGLPADLPPEEGMGIRGMRERVSLLGGTFDVEGSDSGGFRVKAILPVASLNQTQ